MAGGGGGGGGGRGGGGGGRDPHASAPIVSFSFSLLSFFLSGLGSEEEEF